MMLRFLSLAQARGLIPRGYESEAEGSLENVEGKYRITEVTIRPRIIVTDETELELTREVIESVEANCFISNSVNSKIKLIAEVVVARSSK